MEDNLLIKFLTAVKLCDGKSLRKIKFPGRKFTYLNNNQESIYELEELEDNRVKLSRVFLDEEQICIPEHIGESIVVAIGKNACSGKRKLRSLTTPNSIKDIEEGAFADCARLKTVVLGNSVEKIGDCDKDEQDDRIFGNGLHRGVFENSGIEQITLPNSVKVLGENTFKGCSRLSKIEMPQNIKHLSRNCFHMCTTLETVIFNEGIIEIGCGAFYGCTALKSIDLPESIETIMGSAFQGCKNLSSVILKNGVREIGVSAFRGCEKLVEISIPESVTVLHTHVLILPEKQGLRLYAKKTLMYQDMR